jgi:hypothetical protein
LWFEDSEFNIFGAEVFLLIFDEVGHIVGAGHEEAEVESYEAEGSHEAEGVPVFIVGAHVVDEERYNEGAHSSEIECESVSE